MISLEDPPRMIRNIDTAHAAGAHLRYACAVAGINTRTLQRRKTEDGLHTADLGPWPNIRSPRICSPEQAYTALPNQPSARIVPTMADEDLYITSELSIQRV